MLIAESQDAIALRGQPCIPFGVMKPGIGQIVSEAVDLNDETRAMECEIGDVTTDRRLAANT